MYFQRHNVNLSDKAFQAGKKSIERMEERVPGTEYDPLQYFLSNSRWEWEPLNNQIASDGDKLLGGQDDSALIIDETGISKKGKKSVGVAQQWCGQLGKVDNCQVAVVAALERGYFSIPIDFRLFLPEEWIKDKKRCERAKIPMDQAVFKTKHQQAREMLFQARRNGVRLKWVGFDGFYSDNPAFLRHHADNGEECICDIHHKDHKIYYEDPKPVVPPPTSSRGKGRRMGSKTSSRSVEAVRNSRKYQRQDCCGHLA